MSERSQLRATAGLTEGNWRARFAPNPAFPEEDKDNVRCRFYELSQLYSVGRCGHWFVPVLQLHARSRVTHGRVDDDEACAAGRRRAVRNRSSVLRKELDHAELIGILPVA